jgi:glyoxylase-like metal-dependent hydrolase (beta-lactamase superfamily II)
VSHAGLLDLGGGVTVDLLCDAVADHPRALPDAFPGAPAGGWEATRAAFPATVGPAGRWRFPTHVALVRTPDATVLVDAGVGPAGTTAAEWLGVTGELGADLAALGVAADDVDVVVVTHLHSDHLGGLAAPGAGRPAFARARHVVDGDEWASAHAGEVPPAVAGAFAPVEAAGLLDVGGRLPGGLRAVPLRGHTPGHQGVLVEGAAGRALIAGDAFNHPLQLTEPEIPSLADRDRPRAADTRREVLRRARDEGLTVVGSHLPGARWSAAGPAGPRLTGPAAAGG